MPTTLQTSLADFPEFSQSTFASSNFAASVRGRPPVFPRAFADARPAALAARYQNEDFWRRSLTEWDDDGPE